MSKKLTRREFLRLAGVTSLAGLIAACTQKTEMPADNSATDEPAVTEEVMDTPENTPEDMGELAVLDYYWVGGGDTPRTPSVEDAINAYIEPLINANVKFHIIGWGDWATKAVTGLQAGEKIDIFFTADWYYYMQLVSEGLFRPLNDDAGEYGNLLEEYGQGILAGLNPAFVTGTQVDGVNYAVPTNKELTVPEGFVYNLTWAEEIGLTEEEAAKIKSEADLEPWLAKAKEAYPDEYPYVSDGRVGFQPWVAGFASGLSSYYVDMKLNPDDNGVFDETLYVPYETDWFKDYCAIMRDWYEKGYMHPDIGLTTYEPNDAMNAGKFLVQPMPLKGSNIKAQELVNASGNPDLRMGEIYGSKKVNITVHSGGSMLAIPMFSEYPVQAMKYINLMHTDSKLVNMMLFGVEGTDWEFEDDGRVNIIDSTWYGSTAGAWTIGNIMLQAVSNKEDPEKNRKLIEYANDSYNHPSLGFRFRNEAVAAEITAVNAVNDGTSRALLTGYIDPATEIPTFIEDLKAAGLDAVVDEVKAQYAAWEASK